MILHQSEKEREKKVRSMVKKECVMCSGERKWEVGTTLLLVHKILQISLIFYLIEKKIFKTEK